MRGTGEERLARRLAAPIKPGMWRVRTVSAAFWGVQEGTLLLLRRARKARGGSMDSLLYGMLRNAERTGWL